MSQLLVIKSHRIIMVTAPHCIVSGWYSSGITSFFVGIADLLSAVKYGSVSWAMDIHECGIASSVRADQTFGVCVASLL
jgi:hypothetical protein